MQVVPFHMKSLIRYLFTLHSFPWPTAPSEPGRTRYRGFSVTLRQTHRTRQDPSGRVISLTQRLLPGDTHHSQETETRTSDGIRTPNPSKRAAVNPLLQTPRQLGSIPKQYLQITKFALSKSIHIYLPFLMVVSLDQICSHRMYVHSQIIKQVFEICSLFC